jgi:hypothetical protein
MCRLEFLVEYKMPIVTMTCMTTKQKFDVEDPEVIVLRNGRYAYRCPCPWEGKHGKQLFAFKFASAAAYTAYQDAQKEPEEAEMETQISEDQ